MSSRPSAIVKIRAKNPQGSILLDVNGSSVGGQMPLKIEPWGVEIISTTWKSGAQSDDMYFIVTDVDEKQYEVHDYTSNRRLRVGEQLPNGINVPSAET